MYSSNGNCQGAVLVFDVQKLKSAGQLVKNRLRFFSIVLNSMKGWEYEEYEKERIYTD